MTWVKKGDISSPALETIRQTLLSIAEFYNRAAIYSRDAISRVLADFTRFGGQDARSGEFAGHVGPPPFFGTPGCP